MTRLRDRWSGRAAAGVAMAVAGYAVAVWLDMGPQPLPYAVWAVVVLATAYLVINTADVPAAEWQQVPQTMDRVDEASSDLRVLSSHVQSDQPSDALARRLVALARARDPDLGDALWLELADTRRLAPADIDRILTRIEDVRERR
ncbi:hypothetical protein NYO98_04230 [Nocardioides sp. STR2]|uniref:Uncharacterized protein n=1 Tax=Nocardioides pini TaxID=2975053 RepID=A0ABT4C937_9ACTN|nr:hypothetical protein [Nocardioides pini]MCY4725477.1 hypothetical protein [Nocardioides pini]